MCKELGILEGFDQLTVMPVFYEDKNMLVMDLVDARRIRMKQLVLNDFALPTWQREEEEWIDEMEMA